MSTCLLVNSKKPPKCDDFQEKCRNAYRGGYNASMRIGYYDEDTYDYDLENAYLTCMSLIPDVDWENVFAYSVPSNSKLTSVMVPDPFAPIVAYVSFRFPDSVKFPCIPISHNGSLIFPRSNLTDDGYIQTCVSAPDLYLALKLGADITVHDFFAANIKYLPKFDKMRHDEYDFQKRLIIEFNDGRYANVELLLERVNGGGTC